MKITITFMNDSKCNNYQLNNDITIKQALEVISTNDQFIVPEHIQFLYSKRKQENISVNLTFEQANIYSGDILEVKNSGGKENE